MHFKACISGAILTLTAFASATPLEKRITWAPPIILPDANTIWRIGDLVNVTWNNSNPPEPLTFPTGRIQLNNRTGPIPSWEYGILSEGFDIKLGFAELEVPWYGIEPGEYSITLFGDSGNRSPFFHIIAREEEGY